MLAARFRTGDHARAVERSEFDHGDVAERYFLRGIKRFRGKDEGPRPGAPVPTSEHPIQTSQWGDYTVAPAGGLHPTTDLAVDESASFGPGCPGGPAARRRRGIGAHARLAP